MPENEIYSEQQVAAIMRRAAELQEQKVDSGYVPGVTKAELDKLAQEIGIDPAFLELALEETKNSTNTKSSFGWSEEYERVVDFELQPEDFDVLLSQLKPMKSSQPLSQVGRTLQGKIWTGSSVAHITVTSRNGRTKIKVKSWPFLAIMTTLYPAFILTLTSVGVIASGLAPLLWAGLVALLWTIAFVAFRLLLGKGNSDSRKLADKLQAAVLEEAGGVRTNLGDAAPVDKVGEQSVQS